MQDKLLNLRLPLDGHIDLTYRCNNHCRHCWLWLPAKSREQKEELTFDEIKRIVDEARSMGCRKWSISGGEPMLRPDFPEIFDYVTRKAVSYTLNTNGTLITPEMATILKRKGTKMVALYGATKETYDHVTRHPGGFEKVMRGFRYLKEAGAGFMVQLIPMRDNWHEWDEMQEMAKTLSKHWRVGAPWLYLSASGDPRVNEEIRRQRLDPKDVVELDKPDMTYEENMGGETGPHSCQNCEDDYLFASCINGRRDFHVDPYGKMSFCAFLKDPAFRYDLRQGSFEECWEEFIPSLAVKVQVGREYVENCGTCENRRECRWCAVYAWLEHRRFSAPVEHLCEVATANSRFKKDWRTSHRRFYKIAGITIQVDSDLPFTDQTFHPKFAAFGVDGPGPDTVSIRHHFSLPDLTGKDLGREMYRKPPWAIYRQNSSYIYLGISPQPDDPTLHRVATFNNDHSRAKIYNNQKEVWLNGDLHSLTLFPSDQVLIARLLADRQGCYFHSAAAIVNGVGMIFIGHSEAGKTTTTHLLMDAGRPGNGSSTHQVEILCDDRNIVRRREDGWWVYGTWSHGDNPLVSPNGAPLRAIFFIEQADENTLTPLIDRKEIVRRLLGCVVKSFVTADWWNKTLDTIERMSHEAPCYVMRFDRTGKIVEELVKLADRPSFM